MGDKCNKERNRSRNRIGRKKKKALKQLKVLASAKRPLGILALPPSPRSFVHFHRDTQSAAHSQSTKVPYRQPILQESKVSTMDPSQRRIQGLPQGCMYAAGTESNERNARNNAASLPSKRFYSGLLEAVGYHGGVYHQKRPTPAISSYQCTERDESVTVDPGCVSFHQSLQTQTSYNSSLLDRSESRARDDLHLRMEEAMLNPNLEWDARIRIVHGLWEEHETYLKQQSKIKIVKLKLDCITSTDAQADSLQQIRTLKESYNNLDSECRSLEAHIARLRGHLENSHYRMAAMKEELQQYHDGMISLNEENQLLKSSLAEQQNCHQHESPERPESRNIECCTQQNAITGSYVAESATPPALNIAMTVVKESVKNFQRALTDAVKSSGDVASTITLLQPDVYFARKGHVNFATRAVVFTILFEGFENESFNTDSGATRFLDPEVRQAEFFKYFMREKEQHDTGERGDPDFEYFCEMKVPCLWAAFNLRQENSNKQSMQAACLEAYGGPKLLSSFRAAAKSVWLLHKLAFSFEPPASIFRVERGADVDPNYMDSVVSLEDSNRFVNKVGFMISPGLRLRQTTLRSDVYLSSTSAATA